jgi:hypothetical protein
MEGPRLILMAKPDATTLSALRASFESTGLLDVVGGDLSPPKNWHQSLSGRYNDTAENRRLLLEAATAVSAAPLVLGFNRLVCGGGPKEFHWSLKPSKTPPAFDALLAAVKLALVAKRMDEEKGHAAHISLSYWAKTKPENRPVRRCCGKSASSCWCAATATAILMNMKCWRAGL